MLKPNQNFGYTIVEIIATMAVFLLIAGMSLAFFSGRGSHTQAQAIADGLVANLERAKSDAIGGKSGLDWGVYLTSASYTYFGGTSYTPGNTNDIISAVPSPFVLSDTIPGDSIIFAKHTGRPTTSGTITITNPQNAADTKVISVGTGGEISVVQ